MQTAAQRAQPDVKDTKTFIRFLRYFLLAFAAVALFVGGFVIFNTLSITVAQRAREFATLRMLGASRRQVLRSVLLGGRGDRRAGLARPASGSASCWPRGSAR